MTEDRRLIDHILSGAHPELQQMAARGLLPLAPDEIIPVQVTLALEGADARVRENAERSLAATEPRTLAGYIAGAPVEHLVYFAGRAEHPLVLEALIRRRDIPNPLLAQLAPRLFEDLQEILLLRQDAIIQHPAILDALESNPRLSRYADRRVREYRQHLLPRLPDTDAVALEELPTAEPEGVDEWDDEQLAAAIEEVRQQPAGGERDDDTGLSDAQIRLLPPMARMKLARGANRGLRGILVRDANPQVALAVVKFNALPDPEVERISSNRSVCEEVLREIGSRREWVRKHKIVLALVKNPKTPVDMAMKFVSRLAVRDLRELSRSHNISEAVRSTARRMYTIKRQ